MKRADEDVDGSPVEGVLIGESAVVGGAHARTSAQSKFGIVHSLTP